MSDQKRTCPSCLSSTTAVGEAMSDDRPCPVCGHALHPEMYRETVIDDVVHMLAHRLNHGYDLRAIATEIIERWCD